MSELCLTLNNIPYAECDDGYEEKPNNDGQSAGRLKLRCAWSNRVALANYVLSANTSNINGTTIDVGMSFPGRPAWYAMGVSILPADNSRREAFIDIAFKPLEFNPLAPTLVREERISLASQVIPLASRSVKFADGKKADDDDQFLITYLTYKVTLKGVSTVPMAAVISCLNKIHNGTFNFRVGTGSTTTVPGDQVLYNGIDDIAVGYTGSGSQRFDVTHNFLISPISLNKVYNPNHTPASDNVFARFETVTPTKYDKTNLGALGV